MNLLNFLFRKMLKFLPLLVMGLLYFGFLKHSFASNSFSKALDRRCLALLETEFGATDQEVQLMRFLRRFKWLQNNTSPLHPYPIFAVPGGVSTIIGQDFLAVQSFFKSSSVVLHFEIFAQFDNGEISLAQFHHALEDFRFALFENVVDQAAAIVRTELPERVLPLPITATSSLQTRQDLWAKLAFTTYPQPIVVGERLSGGVKFELHETGHYELSQRTDPGIQELNNAILSLRELGGEVRVIKYFNTRSQSYEMFDTPAANLRWDDNGQVYLGIDFTNPMSVASLKHELVHVDNWLAERRAVARVTGHPEVELSLWAQRNMQEPQKRFEDEQSAVNAELDFDSFQSQFNYATSPVVRDVRHYGYIARMVYPHLEAALSALRLARESVGHGGDLGLSPYRNIAKHYVREAIAFALESRRQAIYEFRRESFLVAEATITEMSLFNAIFTQANQEKAFSQGWLYRIQKLYREIWEEEDFSNYFVAPGDQERFELQLEYLIQKGFALNIRVLE